jgi:N-acetylmuramoyl-L-alanine amidase
MKMSKTVYLSPSTQEKNVGACDFGTEEKRMNQICDVVEKILKQHKVTTYRNNPSMSIKQVVADSNKKKPGIHVALHSNAYNKISRGCEVFCWKQGVEGEKLAKLLYKYVAEITPSADRGIKYAYNFYGVGKHIYEVANTTAPASLIEIAFHDNQEDSIWIIKNVPIIGIAIAKAILEYLGIKYEAGILYRVMAGSYSEKNNAEAQVQKLKKAGFDAVIMKYQR